MLALAGRRRMALGLIARRPGPPHRLEASRAMHAAPTKYFSI